LRHRATQYQIILLGDSGNIGSKQNVGVGGEAAEEVVLSRCESLG